MTSFITTFRMLRTDARPAEIYIAVHGSARSPEEAAANAMRELAKVVNADDVEWVMTKLDHSEEL